MVHHIVRSVNFHFPPLRLGPPMSGPSLSGPAFSVAPQQFQLGNIRVYIALTVVCCSPLRQASNAYCTIIMSSKGYPTDIFRDISVPIVKYLCALCHLVLCNPVQRYCGHRYCKNCIDEANAESAGSDTVCPSCAEDDIDEEPLDDSTRKVCIRVGFNVPPNTL